jgi:HTH-type transcriptional regulator/antitoxin HigA
MVKNMSGLSNEFIIHPGETLEEVLENRKMSQRELAMRTGMTDAHISNIVNCKKSISVSFAKKLEYALGIDASFWINLQSNYEKELADFEEVNAISSEELEILQKLKSITKHLKKIGFLAKDVYEPMLVLQLRKLLNVSNLKQIPEVSKVVGAYRLEMATKVEPYVLFTWLRMCDLITDHQQIEQKLDINKLKKKLPQLKELMFENDFARIQSRLKTYFGECGIKFAIAKHFKGAPVQGVIKKNNDGTLSLIMTIRRKFADIFWFTLFHEIGHIINGDFEDKLIDYVFAESEAEDRANEFAANILIDSDKYEQFVKKGDYSLSSIQQFCSEQNIPSYTLIGRLQKDKHLKYHQYSTEKIRYELDEIRKQLTK